MSQWTEGANKEWELYCNEVRTLLSKTEADAKEVIEDMRRHIEAELSAAGASVVTEHDVQRVVKRIGLPDIEQISNQVKAKEDSPVNKSTNSQPSAVAAGRRASTGTNVLIILCGVLLPVGALFVELVTGICSEVFFDPVPTIWHVLLFLLIPASNLTVCIAVSKGKVEHYGKLGLFNSAGIGISFIYTLLFAPILPVSVIAILCFGLGFCGLAPLFSFLAALYGRRYIKRLAPPESSKGVPGLWLGLGLSVLAMSCATLPASLTHIGIQMAASDSPSRQIRGVRLLRAVGNEDILLELCYRRFGIMTDLFTALVVAGDPPTPEQVRGIYYRVTGKPFNSVPPPLTGMFGIRQRSSFMTDFDQGDVRVGAQLIGLSLVSSRMDGSIDSDAALGYIEWTMVFRNDYEWDQREARTQIQLPAGGVVSRLTLWIDGEEREAAFASRKKTREAYQAVVRRRRDPVLVTTHGPDRILMQCFPVPPKGGEMKARIGITVPLQLVKDDEAVLRLPHFNERNFGIPEAVTNAVWIESKRPLKTRGESLATETTNTGVYTIRGDLTDGALLDEQGTIRASRQPDILQAWTSNPVKGSTHIIVQSITPTTAKPPKRVVLVIDSSMTMGPVIQDLAEVIATIPSGMEVMVLVAADEIERLTSSVVPMTAELGQQLAASIRKIKPHGGIDNLPALQEGWDISSEASESVIVWIHAIQPQLFETVESLRQRWERRPSGPTLIDVQAVAGVNRIIESLDGFTQVSSLPCTGSLERDMKRLFELWRGSSPAFEVIRKSSVEAIGPSENAKQTSAHLARLWAKDEVDDLRRTKPDNFIDKATAIATTYQLVTPVSGAVVLETAEQYTRAGLQPVDSATVPTIPEPEIWALMIITACILFWIAVRKRMSLRPA
ncbi:MAG: hypothetical protein GWN67_06285 [Phycisphaerae bacterium]|nr:hypothetical protein [Phycisphaerae bacterium]NIR62561.1 hypothetical protein [candidate division Zixibacteria bacterium]NIP51566.1 hypothetical protein [Phycisphaerae bacterium]NIS50716.1 hypothetical protein [Phycisphaerae bacterium]NIU08476.1 hypothetical protein [Phycisphaerae bacterium]